MATNIDLAISYVHFGPSHTFYDDHQNCNLCNTVQPKWWNPISKFFKKGTCVKNEISSTQYTPLTIFPMSFLNQLKRKANIYFIFIGILYLTPLFGQNKLFSVMPLMFVLLVSILKDVNEFINLKRDDQKENSIKEYRFGFEKMDWENIRRADISMGDFILVRKDREIPADVVLVQSSLPTDLCSINTTNLDGETNLKVKRSVEGYQIMQTKGEEIDGMELLEDNASGFVKSDAPNARMDSNGWNGSLFLEKDGCSKFISLDMSQFIMRGSVLKNTDWIIGLVIFAGEDTKLQQQQKKKKTLVKSQLEKRIENFLLAITIVMACLVALSTTLHILFLKNPLWYMSEYNESIYGYIKYAFFILLILTNMIPISLYVTVEFSNLVQGLIINTDNSMASKEIDRHAKTRNSALTTDLGQIQIIFSDKTGTLTKNNMTFFKCSLRGEIFSVEGEKIKGCNKKLLGLLKEQGQKEYDETLTLLSLCHTALPDFPKCKEKHLHSLSCNCGVEFQAESPDEQALLNMARNHGYSYFRRVYGTKEINNSPRNVQIIHLDIFGQTHEFQIIECFEFDSERKRISVLVFDERDQKLKLYCKGAETVLYDLLSAESKGPLWNKTLGHIDEFSSLGLRVLVCGYKEISLEHYGAWREKFINCKSDPGKREALINEIEGGLTLLGATAVEDELQDEVSETLKCIRDAGIIVWVLTGDKMQTAFNIAKSCGLLTPRMDNFPNLILIDTPENISDAEALRKLDEKMKDYWQTIKNVNNPDDHALVVSGKALSLIYPNKAVIRDRKTLSETQSILMGMMESVSVVILCRVSPLQKSQIVQFYKLLFPSKVSLSVGDGANDVPMIQQANVGVGIFGREGTQAARSADFCINEFKNLKDLIIFHGAMNYTRTAKLICFCFYKNIILCILMYYYTLMTGFSGTILLPQEGITFHNLMFSHANIFVQSISEICYTKESAFRWPRLYKKGQENRILSTYSFAYYVFLGLFHAAVIILILYVLVSGEYLGYDGYGMPFCYISTFSYMTILAVITIEALILCQSFNYMNILVLVYTLPSYFSISYFFNMAVESGNASYGCIPAVFHNAELWIASLICIALCIFPQVAISFFYTYNRPGDERIVRELEKTGYDTLFMPKTERIAFTKRKTVFDQNMTIDNEEYYHGEKRKGTKWSDFIHSKLIQPISKIE